MKILIDQHFPFLFAHGGANTQVEQTKLALENTGLEVEYLRWWDGGQRGDLVHFFGAPNPGYLQQARVVHMPIIINTLFTETCNRPTSRLRWQGRAINAILSAPFGDSIKQQLAWRSYRNCDHNIVSLEAERRVLEIVYKVPSEKITVVPIGLSDAFLKAGPGRRTEPHLICTGTVTRRKNFVELAQMARATQVPVLFVGKPYHPNDPYWLRFQKLIDHQWVKYCPHVDSEVEMVRLLQSARGFVLMSNFENWCLSAHEAAACGLPVLLPDQNWSRERFGDQARYFDRIEISQRNIKILKSFHVEAPNLPSPNIRLFSWLEVARNLKKTYEHVLTCA